MSSDDAIWEEFKAQLAEKMVVLRAAVQQARNDGHLGRADGFERLIAGLEDMAADMMLFDLDPDYDPDEECDSCGNAVPLSKLTAETMLCPVCAERIGDQP